MTEELMIRRDVALTLTLTLALTRTNSHKSFMQCCSEFTIFDINKTWHLLLIASANKTKGFYYFINKYNILIIYFYYNLLIFNINFFYKIKK